MIQEKNNLFGASETIIRKQSLDNTGVKEPLIPRIISIVLHPMLMGGVYGVLLLFLYTDFNLIFANQFVRFVSPVFFLTCFVPVSGMYFLKRAGLIKDYELTDKRDRFLPYLTVFLAYLLLIYYFHSAKLYMWFLSTLAAPVILVVIAAIVNIRWKISAI